MRTLLSLVAAVLSLPVVAEELQFDLTGLAAPGGVGPPTVPFEVTFTLNTLSGSSSFSFSYPQPCLTAWQFTGPATGGNVTNFSATVGGQTILNNLPPLFAEGNSGDLLDHCTLENGSIQMDPLIFGDVLTQNTKPLKLNSKDPLADVLSHSLCRTEGGSGKVACQFGFLNPGADLPGYFLAISGVKITRANP